MKAKVFIARLDLIRSAARTDFGTGETHIPKEGALVKQLSELVSDLLTETTQKRTLEIETDDSGNVILTPELRAALGNSVAQVPETSDDEDEPTGSMKVEAIKRDPSTFPNKEIKVEQATEDTVADKDELLATVGD